MAGILTHPLAVRVYRALFANRSNKALKLVPWSLICILLFLRTIRLFLRELTAGVVAVLLLCLAASSFLPALVVCLALELALLVYLSGHIDANRGHRAGAEGYEGACAENTVEALRALLEQDRASSGPLQGCPYVEIDIQETRDGHVVVFHDSHLGRAFPLVGNEEAYAALAAEGLSPALATVQDLSLSQLQGLRLGGRPGAHVPTLQAFLAACVQLRLHRPLAVEIKTLITDGGRAQVLALLREYKPHADAMAQQHLALVYPPFGGMLACISFPMMYARSFGEFGSPAWRRWARQFREAGVPVRSCCCHALSLTYCSTTCRAASA